MGNMEIMGNTGKTLSHDLPGRIRRDSSALDIIRSGSWDGIWCWDLDDNGSQRMDPKLWMVFGHGPEERRYLAAEWRDRVFPEDLKVAIDCFRRHCADPDHPFEPVIRYRDRDGATAWAQLRGVAIRNETGAPVGLLGAYADVTRLKRAEEDLARNRREIAAFSRTIRKTLAEAGAVEDFFPAGLYASSAVLMVCRS